MTVVSTRGAEIMCHGSGL